MNQAHMVEKIIHLKKSHEIMLVTSEQNLSFFSYKQGVQTSENTRNLPGYNDEVIDLKFNKPLNSMVAIATNSSVLKIYDRINNRYINNLDTILYRTMPTQSCAAIL